MSPSARPRLGNVKLYSTKQKPRRRGSSSPRQIAALRLNDLNRLFRARYGITLPDDDAGRDDMMVVLNHLTSLRHPLERIDRWLELWCPWVTLRERNAIAGEAMIHKQQWT